MEKKIIVVAIMLFVMNVCCGQKIKLPYPSRIDYISETEGSMILDVTVFDCSPKECLYYADMDAVYEILFKGIVGSTRFASPFVATAQENDHYFVDMFSNGGFNSFIMAHKLKEKGKTTDKQKYYLVTVNVDMKALKTSLARNNKINQFGIY